MAEGSDRVALPIQVHDFLVACAGRVDDDALTDARELLAVAELDRAVDLLVVCLVAGRIPLTSAERDHLRELVYAVRGVPALVDRIVIDESAALPAHRFTVGTDADPSPYEGVVEAIGRLVDVLPDIGRVSCVWRRTPAGAVSGPVPHRVVLIETGPKGFAVSTAYRVEQALRRAGIRASVEVLRAGADLPAYHRDAQAAVLAVSPYAGAESVPAAPRAVPEAPIREAPIREAPIREAPIREAPIREAPGATAEPVPADTPAPRRVTTTRRRGAQHADRRASASESSGVQWLQRVASASPPEQLPSRRSDASPSAPGARPMVAVAADNQHANGKLVGLSAMAGGRSAVADAPTTHRERVTPLPVATVPAATSAKLSQREQDLLRQLHEELAKREQAGVAVPTAMWPPSGQPSAAVHPVPDYGSGMEWRPSPDQTAINGVPHYRQPSERSGY